VEIWTQIFDGPTTRRGMAFADAVFDGHANLDGVRAVRAADLYGAKAVLAGRAAITTPPTC
jgi:hypothetical protein